MSRARLTFEPPPDPDRLVFREHAPLVRSIEIVPRRSFTFNAPALAATTVLPLALRVDTGAAVSGALIVKLHALSIPGLSAVNITAEDVAYSDDDPTVLFQRTDTPSLAFVSMSGSDVPPKLFVRNFAAVLGNTVRVYLTYSPLLGAGLSTLTISVELVLRDA